MTLEHERLMDIALALSRQAGKEGNRPLGSLIVGQDGQILAQGGNRVYSDFDPTAHAEMVVIRQASRKLKTVDLAGCTLYTSMEPCPMCLWAILESGIQRLVLGARHARVGRQPLGGYSVETFFDFMSRRIELVTGVREAECEAVRREWLLANKTS